MKQTIKIVRGTTETINVNLTDATGAPHVLAEGEMIRFGVKKDPKDKVCILEKVLTAVNEGDSTRGSYVLNLSPADTENLDCGYFFYDIGMQSGAEYFNVIECSPFELLPNITSRKVAE